MFVCGVEIVGAPTIALNLLVNIVEENKRVTGERIREKYPHPPVFAYVREKKDLRAHFVDVRE